MDEDTSVVLIAQKPIDRYIQAILRSFKCILKSRGSNIKRAIDSALIAERDYGYTIKETHIYNETLKAETGDTRFISAIDIELEKVI
jgi:DNA-binding protein Alba